MEGGNQIRGVWSNPIRHSVQRLAPFVVQPHRNTALLNLANKGLRNEFGQSLLKQISSFLNLLVNPDCIGPEHEAPGLGDFDVQGIVAQAVAEMFPVQFIGLVLVPDVEHQERSTASMIAGLSIAHQPITPFRERRLEVGEDSMSNRSDVVLGVH